MERYRSRKFGKQEEAYMEWQISAAKAVVCFRKYKETNDEHWLNLVESHLAKSNSFLQEVDRSRKLIADPVDYLRADRCDQNFVVPIGHPAAFCGGL